MFVFSNAYLRTAVVACALTALGATSSAQAMTQRPVGAATPQELVARLNEAIVHEDLAEYAACLRPRNRREMVMGVLGAAKVYVAILPFALLADAPPAQGEIRVSGDGPDITLPANAPAVIAGVVKATMSASKNLDALLARHDLEELIDIELGKKSNKGLDEQWQEIFAHTDELAFLDDLILLYRHYQGPASFEDFSRRRHKDVLVDLVVEGERATAKLKRKKVSFERIDGVWFAVMPR